VHGHKVCVSVILAKGINQDIHEFIALERFGENSLKGGNPAGSCR
jgi:hypothetical protein